MNQHTNVIDFPAVAAAEKPRRQPPSAADTPIVDLAGRRQALHATVDEMVVAPDTSQLSPDEIWDALNNGRIVMHYQPQYDMQSGRTVAAEALVRLVDRDGQLIGPHRFIESMEQSDLIVLLGRGVIEQVCSDLASARAAGYDIRRVAINLSARQLNVDSTLFHFIDMMVASHGLDHSDLEFEITERQRLLPESKGPAILDALAQRGARIVIDDFGIGYSSILYLAELPVSAFKLDRALVDRLPQDESKRTLVKSLLKLADSLGLEVVAEGIETAEQNEFLVHAGCQYAQGFAYAKPMGIAQFLRFVTQRDCAAASHGALYP